MSTARAPFTLDVRQTSDLAEIAASLPLSLAPVEAAPQIASISGAPGWARRAQNALDGGAVAAVVGSPSAHDDAAGLGRAGSGRLVVAWEHAANPGLLAAVEAAEPLRARAVLAECTVTVRTSAGIGAALLDALTTTSRLMGPFGPVATVFAGPTGWHLAGLLPHGAPLSVAILVSSAGAPALRARLLTDGGGLTVMVPSADTAAPAEVRVVGPDGERLLPTLWETSRRASWRRAIAVASGGPASADVAELHHTASLAPHAAVSIAAI